MVTPQSSAFTAIAQRWQFLKMNDNLYAIGMARAHGLRKLVEVTEDNFKSIQSHKTSWHWLIDNGFDPTKKGWRKRSIGKSIPDFCFVRKL